jgi:predicted transcriptional regulator
MGILISHGEITVTNLAMLSRVNHKRCTELIGWLRASGYVETRMHRNKRYVMLTESGYSYGNRLLEVIAATRIMDAYIDGKQLEQANEVSSRKQDWGF